MSPEPLNLILSEELLARIRAAAAAAGLTPEAWASECLRAALEEGGVREDAAIFDARSRDDLLARQTPEARAFQHQAALAALAHYDETGEHVTLKDWAAEFRADVKARLAAG